VQITTPLRGFSAATARSSLVLSRRALARFLAATPLALATRRTSAQGAVWSMATEYPATTMSGEAIAFFTDRMAKEGSGKITITPAYDATHGLKSAGIVAAIRDGQLARHRELEAAGRPAGGRRARRTATVDLPRETRAIAYDYLFSHPERSRPKGGEVEGPPLVAEATNRSLRYASLRLRSGQALRSAPVGTTEFLVTSDSHPP
jgi:hypothetical protein